MKKTEQEIEQEIIEEIFVKDAYRLPSSIVAGEKWLDVGCHNGWWTKFARSFGADVVGAIDADRQALHRYADLNGHGIPCTHMVVENSEDLLRARIVSGGEATAVKIDIQGAEHPLFMVPEQRDQVARHFDKILMEWHFPRELPAILTALDLHWTIRWVDEALDTMTGERTYLALASR